MQFKQVIEDNVKRYGAKAAYAYHYSDISNIVSILATETLYSRENAEKLSVMHNDNASRLIIDLTNNIVTKCVRFYFRPLTPTQYHNEGYKHVQIRYEKDVNANVPVPIFLVFSLEKLLNTGMTTFSEVSQAGLEKHHFTKAEDFARLNFAKIYSKGPMYGADEIKYRHAELLYPEAYRITDSLQWIVCRNGVERDTLLNLLFEQYPAAYNKFKNHVIIGRKNDLFFDNGLAIDSCFMVNNTVNIMFTDAFGRREYAHRQMQRLGVAALELMPIRVNALLEKNNKPLWEKNYTINVDYLLSSGIRLLLPDTAEADSLKLKISIEGHLVAYIKKSLSQNRIV